MHFQNNVSFISASFCKMCCNQMIVYMLDYNFLVQVPCQLLPGSKYKHNHVFLSFYVLKMTIFNCKYIKKVEAKIKNNNFACIVLFKKCTHSFNNIQWFLYFKVKHCKIFDFFTLCEYLKIWAVKNKYQFFQKKNLILYSITFKLNITKPFLVN